MDSLRAVHMRPEVEVTEIPAPSRLAPHAYALAGNVLPTRHTTDSALGTGRFVLLFDPEQPEPWGGPFRVVCYAQAPLELEIALDPFLSEVAWSWLIDALDARGAEYMAASGTATKTFSTGFGELADEHDRTHIELRASWTPLHTNVSAHLEGWSELLCMLAGLPGGGEDSATLRALRRSRG